MRFNVSYLAAFLCICFSTSAHAGAWTQDSGAGLAIVTAGYYNADDFWNNHGDRQSQPAYDKLELDPYLEYGLLDGLTVGTNLSLQLAHQDITGDGDYNHFGLGDSEFFARARLWQNDGFVLSAEPLIKLPSPESEMSQPRLGGSHPDAGLGLLGGYGFSSNGLNHFVDLDTGYRYRFGEPKDQVRIDATLGYSLTPQWMLMPQVFTTWRTSPPKIASFTESPEDDYDLVRLQLTAVDTMENNVSLQFGGFGDVYGKNSGIGRGVLVAIWKRF